MAGVKKVSEISGVRFARRTGDFAPRRPRAFRLRRQRALIEKDRLRLTLKRNGRKENLIADEVDLKRIDGRIARQCREEGLCGRAIHQKKLLAEIRAGGRIQFVIGCAKFSSPGRR